MKYLLLCIALIILPVFAQANNPIEGRIKVPGGFVWYSITGNGNKTPLLIIHGGPGGSSCSYTALVKALAKDRPVIIYDQLGAGKSDHPNDPSLWQSERFVEELAIVIKNLPFKKINLMAHSWGAAIAAEYLTEKGSNGINSVIFVGPFLSSKDWTADTNELRKQLSATTQDILLRHERAGTTASSEYQNASGEFYKKFLFHHPQPAESGCDDNSWNSTIYEHMWGNSEFIVTGNLKHFDASQHLENIKIPTLFLVGEFDEVRTDTVRKYQRRMPNAKVVVLKDAGHMSMIDEPKAFVTAVDNFLNHQQP